MKKIIFFTTIVVFFTTISFAIANEIELLHKEILYPTVRIRAGSSQGSGLVFASIKNENRFDTYVLTNHHVIDDAITIKEEWNSFKKKMEKKETRATIEIELFKYQNLSVNTGTLLILADIIEWNKDHDLALVKLRSDENIQPVKLLSENKIKDLRIFQSVYVCGAGGGRSPFPTVGIIASLQDEIENVSYWMVTAPSVFGNSGGGTFLQDTREFIGIPSRLVVTWASWAPNAVYHMNYIIPVERIYKWLENTGWKSLYDPKAKTHEEWLKEKKKGKKDEENNSN